MIGFPRLVLPLVSVPNACFLVRFVALLGLVGVAPPAVAAGTGQIFVSNERSSELTILDQTDTVIKQIKTCGRPRGMRFTPDRTKLIVACGSDNTIAVYAIDTQKLVKRFRNVPDPETFDLHPNGHDLYSSNEDDSEATLIDIDTGAVKGHFPTGPEPEGVLVTPDGKTVFVTSEAANLVHVINVDENKLVKDIITATRPRRFALSPDGKELWVTCEMSGLVMIIDTETLIEKGRVDFQPKGMRRDEVTPVDIVMTRDGKTLYAALGRANHVAVVDTASRSVRSYVLVGKRPWGLRLNKAETKLYVANGLSDDLSIIDTASGRTLKTVPVGIVPYGILIDD